MIFFIIKGVRIDVKWPPTDTASTKHSQTNPIKHTKIAKKEKLIKDEGKTEKEENQPKKVFKEKLPSIKQQFSNESSHSSSKEIPPSSNCFEGTTFVFTGTHSLVRRDLIDLIAAHGGVTKQTVTK